MAQVCEVLTWFRGESFANRRDVPRSRCSLTLQLLSLRFTLVLLICGVVFCRWLASGVFCWGDIQLHVQRYRADNWTFCLQSGGRGGGGWRRELGVRNNCRRGRCILLLTGAFSRRILLLLKLLLLEAALLLAEFGPAVFEPNLVLKWKEES